MAEHKMIPVNHPSEIPAFTSEAEEAAFWATHEFGAGMLEDEDRPEPGEVVPPVRSSSPAPRRRTQSITIRIEADTLSRLKAIAARKNMAYQTLLKDFVIERLYQEELRERVVSAPSSFSDAQDWAQGPEWARQFDPHSKQIAFTIGHQDRTEKHP